MEALAFKLRVLLDAEDAAERGSQAGALAEQTPAASPSAPEAEEAAVGEGAVPSGGPSVAPAPAEEASGREGAAAASPSGNPPGAEIEEAHRWARPQNVRS